MGKCACILASGPRKGSQCSNQAKPGSNFCGVHKNCSKSLYDTPASEGFSRTVIVPQIRESPPSESPQRQRQERQRQERQRQERQRGEHHMSKDAFFELFTTRSTKNYINSAIQIANKNIKKYKGDHQIVPSYIGSTE